MNSLVEQARVYALDCHSQTNHLYDGQPYQLHLEMVVATAREFIHLIPEDAREQVLAGCWVHDVIEDCRQTYNDVRKATSETVAEIAYALTNEKGKTRQERANEKYYQGICDTPFAVFVKCCDRLANARYAAQQQSRMFEVYKNEHPAFQDKLWQDSYKDLFTALEQLFTEEKSG